MAELWDDSALITAFNSAMAKYKDMHGQGYKQKNLSQDANVETLEGAGLESSGLVLDPEKNSREAKKYEHPEKVDFEVMQEDSVVVSTETLMDKVACEPECPPLSDKQADTGNPTYALEQEQIMSELQQLAEQQKKLQERLTYLANVGSETSTIGATHNGCSASEYYSGVAPEQTYPATGDYCYSCQWNAYYGSNPSWSSALHCQDCGYVSNPYNNQEYSKIPCATSNSTFQKLPNTCDLPDLVHAAVAEALKSVETQNSSGQMKGTANTEFSDVAVAWFLAGFHTSRYLLNGRAPH